MYSTVRILLGVSLVLVLSCASAGAQATGQINGTVTDPTGALLPGVDITATQTDTGIGRATITNETGSFVLPNLALGPYRLEVSLPGFQSFVQTGITLQINSSVVINATLAVGQVAQTIEVVADAVMVESRATGIGQVIDNIAILELPLVGRQVQDLIVLAGAAVQVGTENQRSRSFPGVARFSIAGGFDRGNSYTLDGASHNDVRRNIGLPLPFPDALQEFKVEISAVPAQYGFRSGGAINAVTKSGTNQFHGNAFWFVRNDVFNARGFFDTDKDPLKRNQFGGTIGGPIIENRMFFFAGYQGTTNRRAPTGNTSFVPTAAMIAGDFSTFASTACQNSAITLAAPFVNNVAPQSALSPAAVNAANRLPDAVDACGTTVWGEPLKTDEHQFIGRMDYQLNDNHSIFVRYMGYPFDAAVGTDFSDNALATGTPGQDNLFQTGTVGDTLTFGNNMINSFRVGWNRQAIRRANPTYFDVDDLGVNAYHQIDGMMIIDVDNAFTVGSRTSAANNYNETGYVLSDDLGWISGNHQFNIGATWMSFQTNNNSLTNTPGLWEFDGGVTGLPMADFMLGRMTRLSQGAPSFNYVRSKVFGLYAQDSWRVQPSLTLSLGLRWEPYLPQRFERDQSVYFDIDGFLAGQRTSQYANAPAGFFYPGDSQFPAGGNSTNVITTKWDKFAPRLGLSWDPMGDGRTVFRAAYGIFYETQNSEFNLTVGHAAPWAAFLSRNDVSFDDPWQGFPGGNPFPFVPNENSPYPQGSVFSTWLPETHPPYVQQWNVGMQRQIGTDWLVAASYIGNQAAHVYGSRELNPGVFIDGVADANGDCFATVMGQSVSLNVGVGGTCTSSRNTQNRRVLNLLDSTGTLGGSTYGNLAVWDDGGTRSYNGMLLSVNKRMSDNFSLTGNYTWSHCIGTPVVTLIQGRAGSVGFNDPNDRSYDRGNCGSQDRRHLLNGTLVLRAPQFSNPTAQAVFGNWSASGILRARSGGHLSPTMSPDIAGTGSNTRSQRPDIVSSNVYGSQCKDDLRSSNPTCLWLNPAAFSNPTLGTLGNAGAGVLVGPGSWTIDAGLRRTFDIGDTQEFEIRAEATNVLNHTNLNNPRNRLGRTFGRITSAGAPRVIQFGIKYGF